MDIPKRVRKRLTFTTADGGHTVHVVKSENESVQHVLMKALLWAMHADAYPAVQIEREIGDRYTPDCVSLDATSGEPLFWGECGRVELSKVASIVERFQLAHVVIAKWGINPVGYAAQLARVVADGRVDTPDPQIAPHLALDAPRKGAGPGAVEVVSVPEDSEARFFAPLDHAGSGSTYVVTPDRSQLQWVRVWPDVGAAAAAGVSPAGRASSTASSNARPSHRGDE
ncbi:hypothetical protein KFE25_010919 [Diacronema lutheri]|uniref:Uncharacterized protein n=2 Tax=Diacronema lutheri TaxID=2081491 RepID=A0A8J5XHB6_DIALT|nr:hypothetical protein KFE25_009796 [Diacronema lutheri]KAG8460864.1 hypothetical protein KFE25_010919 [Diacronema lutheri]